MSFSTDVKDELVEVISSARHCQLSELSAINLLGPEKIDDTTHAGRKCFTLQKKASMINRYVELRINNSCCKRAFIRGAFLCVGSMSDPAKAYNLEFVFKDLAKAELLKGLFEDFNINAKVSRRKTNYVLYIREADLLVDALNVMGAHKSLMALESLRVEKELSNSINRKVNCETANIAKAVSASAKQIEGIQKIERVKGLEFLPESLKVMAEIRLEHPESSMTELGGYFNPPIGKSGVNHRLRKLCEIAESIEE